MAEYPSVECTITNLTISNNLSKKASTSIREYLCYKTYLDAQEGFGEWFSHYHHGKPTPLEELSTYATFTEKVAYDHRKAQYNVELDRWKSTMQYHTKVYLASRYRYFIGRDNDNKTERNTYTHFAGGKTVII